MDRKSLLRSVSGALGRRRLVWAGIRGDDAEPLADLPQFEAAYSIINAYQRRSSVQAMAYEDLTGVRVDLETWDIDDHLRSEATAVFRRALLQSLAQPSALLPYRPSRFLSAIGFARRDRCRNLGLFGAHQNAFEHKPWLESSIADLGIPHIPWTYVADDEQLRTRDLVSRGAVMLRRSRTSGGEGIIRVDDPTKLPVQWPHADEAFVSVAPYLDGGLPVNVGATVWRDGVTVHHPSIQLIGIPSCVIRPFGYCGNDFGGGAALERRQLDQIEDATRSIGNWLRSYGYRGTYGVDFLIHRGIPLFTEVNPRFQGSTHSSCQLSIEAGQSCLMLEHIAAMLDLPAPPPRPLHEVVRETSPLSNLVVHWTGLNDRALDPGSMVRRMLTVTGFARADVLARPTITTQVGAAVARFTLRQSISTTGFDLGEPWLSIVGKWNEEQNAREPVTASIEKRS